MRDDEAQPTTDPDILRELRQMQEHTEERTRTGARLDGLTETVTGLKTELSALRAAQELQTQALTKAFADLSSTLSGLNSTVQQLGQQVHAMRVAAEADVAVQKERMELERSAPERWRLYGSTAVEVLKAAGGILGVLGAGAAAAWALFGGHNGSR